VLNNSYYKNTLEAVTQGSEVGGYPSKILSLLKTTLFTIVVFINNVYSEEVKFYDITYIDNVTYSKCETADPNSIIELIKAQERQLFKSGGYIRPAR
jgi:esterase/lipase superfamily enzyme